MMRIASIYEDRMYTYDTVDFRDQTAIEDNAVLSWLSIKSQFLNCFLIKVIPFVIKVITHWPLLNISLNYKLFGTALNYIWNS